MILNVSVALESIRDLDELKSLMKIQISLKVSWIDSRLTFINVHKNLVNPITLVQKKKLWMPSLVFDNTNDKTEVSFDDPTSNGIIKLNMDANRETVPLNSIHNYVKYTGIHG